MTNKSYFCFPKLAHNLWTDRKIDDPHPTTSKKYLYHTRAMDRGRSFIHLRSLEARTIQDRLLSEEVEWNGSDYPLASALTLLTSPTLCLLRFLIHVLMSISICMILILQSIYPLVLPIELLSMFFPFREMVTVPNAELAAVPGQDHKHHEPVKQQKLWAKAHSSFSDLRSRYVRTSSHSLCFMAYQ